MSDTKSMIEAVRDEARRRGWDAEVLFESGDFVDIRLILPPPSMGVHVQDGVGTREELGG